MVPNHDHHSDNAAAANATTKSSLLTYREVAAWLSISESYVRRLVMHRKIPIVKIGRSVRFRPTDIEQWIERRNRG